MRPGLTVTLVMVAFAANTVLNRLALLDSSTGPAAFALVLGGVALSVRGVARVRGQDASGSGGRLRR